MSFRYEQGPVVTILVSKSAGRYRVQSDSFEAMWLIVQVWSAASFTFPAFMQCVWNALNKHDCHPQRQHIVLAGLQATL